MLLRNLQAVGGTTCDINVRNGRIIFHGGASDELYFDDAIVFPGLINSHDHLDFNLFPQLANRRYANYVEWSEDIHRQNKDAINDVLKVPEDLRIKWGIYKNLLCGVTTVVNHGKKIPVGDDLINVFQQCHFYHSVRLEKYLQIKMALPRKNGRPVVIHIGEGTDEATSQEIDKLIGWNVLKKEITGIHGVCMSAAQARHFRSLVWCPVSNYFLLGKTADVASLKEHVPIVFGTDSTLTAGWNIWDHLRCARNGHGVEDAELFRMVTEAPAGLWRLADRGRLADNYAADIVIARKKSTPVYDAFFAVGPEDILLVMHNGAVRLFDDDLKPQLLKQQLQIDGFTQINVNGSTKHVRGDLPGLEKKIKSYYPEAQLPFDV